MKIELDYNQYMAMLKAFTEYAQCKAECYRLQAENENLKHEVSELKSCGSHIDEYEAEKGNMFFLDFCMN